MPEYKKDGGLKKKYTDIKKNIEALKQFNITIGQMPVLMKAFGVWWNVTRNLKEIEGSWNKAFATYAWMFKGVPRKKIHKIYDPYCEAEIPDKTSNALRK